MRKLQFDWAAAAAWVFFSVAIGVLLWHGRMIWGSDLAGSDPPAHFTTGVMVYEYFRHSLFSNPMAFARSFYIRFPKVALGHWPPAFYVLQTIAYGIARPSIAVARILCALIGVTLATVLLVRIRALHGLRIGVCASSCFLMLPLLQGAFWVVMSDLLAALLMLLATLSFAGFMDSEKPRDAVWFAIWATLAVLTKGSGWALGIMALLAPIFARRASCFRHWWYWISGASVVILAAPFYYWAQSIHVGYPADVSQMAHSGWDFAGHLFILRPFIRVVPAAVFAVVIAGVGFAWFRGGTVIEAAVFALIVSQAVFLLILPLTEETRYYLPAAAAMTFFIARAMTSLHRRAGPFLLAAICFAACGIIHTNRIDGYWAAVDSIPYSPRGVAILVDSDSYGEGAWVAERLDHDRARAGIVIRASKVIAASDWSGSNYRLLMHDPAEVLRYIQSVPVSYVVIDQAAPSSPHGELIQKAVTLAPGVFSLTGRFPVSGRRAGSILIYENTMAVGKPFVIHLNFGSRDTIEYRN